MRPDIEGIRKRIYLDPLGPVETHALLAYIQELEQERDAAKAEDERLVKAAERESIYFAALKEGE